MEKLFKEGTFIALLDANAVVGFAGPIDEFKAFLKKDRANAEELIRIANQPRSEYKP